MQDISSGLETRLHNPRSSRKSTIPLYCLEEQFAFIQGMVKEFVQGCQRPFNICTFLTQVGDFIPRMAGI